MALVNKLAITFYVAYNTCAIVKRNPHALGIDEIHVK